MELLLLLAWLVLGNSSSKPLVKESLRFDPIEIDLVNSKTDRLIRDRYEKLALDKVMRNRNERQCVDKDDSMTDMTDLKK